MKQLIMFHCYYSLSTENLAVKLTAIIHIDPLILKTVKDLFLFELVFEILFFSTFNDIFIMMTTKLLHFCG